MSLELNIASLCSHESPAVDEAEFDAQAAFRPSTTIHPTRLIVIMLFRLQMSIDEAIHLYTALTEKIFSPKNLGGYEDIECLFHILAPSRTVNTKTHPLQPCCWGPESLASSSIS